MTARTNKPVMAEMLVRQVFGDAESFERVCAQRGLSVEDAVRQALRGWVGHGVGPSESTVPFLGGSFTPDPGDCPSGQEEHWIQVCEHDLTLLRKQQQNCFRLKDQRCLERTTHAIENYIQTLASLKERVRERVVA